MLTHATPSDVETVLSAIGGPLLFLIGTILFKHTFGAFFNSRMAWDRCARRLAWFASALSPVLLSILTAAIMVVVAAWESISLRSGARR